MSALLDPRLGELDRLRCADVMYDTVIDEVDGRYLRVRDHWLTDFASCNYLGLDLDEEVIDRVTADIRRWGTHPGWSRLIGSPRHYPAIEDRLAALLGTEDSLVLPTITHIHLSVLPALAGTGDLFVAARAHRTIYDGSIQARGRGATLHRFRVDDPDQLAGLLRAAPAAGPRVVCVDGVDSMTGNVPDLAVLAGVCREHDALLYVDDAHGFGVLGEQRPDETSPYGARGNSVIRHLGLDYDNVILVGGFSKAYSSLLAFIALPTVLKNHLKIAATPYLYSGPSPFASLAGVLAGLDVNDSRGEQLRARLYRHSARLLTEVRRLGLDCANTTTTPIVELPLAAGRDLGEVARYLWRRGIYVTLAAYPLVPHREVGFRAQMTAAHTDGQVDELIRVIGDLAAEGTLRTRT